MARKINLRAAWTVRFYDWGIDFLVDLMTKVVKRKRSTNRNDWGKSSIEKGNKSCALLLAVWWLYAPITQHKHAAALSRHHTYCGDAIM